VLDYVTDQPNVKLTQSVQDLSSVTDVNLIVGSGPDRISIALENLDSFNAHSPFVPAIVTLPRFQIFARNHSPFSEADTDLENGLRIQPSQLGRDKGNIAGIADSHVFSYNSAE